MIVPLRKRANQIFRDFEVDNEASSGVYNPVIADIQLWFLEILRALVFTEGGLLKKKEIREWGTRIETLLADRLPKLGSDQ